MANHDRHGVQSNDERSAKFGGHAVSRFTGVSAYPNHYRYCVNLWDIPSGMLHYIVVVVHSHCVGRHVHQVPRVDGAGGSLMAGG